jgi:hypothetical protein
MAAAVYTVTTTINPGVQYPVSQDEYERLSDLGLVASLVSVTVPADAVIVSTIQPSAPAVGQVWANNSIP